MLQFVPGLSPHWLDYWRTAWYHQVTRCHQVSIGHMTSLVTLFHGITWRHQLTWCHQVTWCHIRDVACIVAGLCLDQSLSSSNIWQFAHYLSIPLGDTASSCFYYGMSVEVTLNTTWPLNVVVNINQGSGIKNENTPNSSKSSEITKVVKWNKVNGALRLLCSHI